MSIGTRRTRSIERWRVGIIGLEATQNPEGTKTAKRPIAEVELSFWARGTRGERLGDQQT